MKFWRYLPDEEQASTSCWGNRSNDLSFGITVHPHKTLSWLASNDGKKQGTRDLSVQAYLIFQFLSPCKNKQDLRTSFEFDSIFMLPIIACLLTAFVAIKKPYTVTKNGFMEPRTPFNKWTKTVNHDENHNPGRKWAEMACCQSLHPCPKVVSGMSSNSGKCFR